MGISGSLKRVYGDFLIIVTVVNFAVMIGFVVSMVFAVNGMELGRDIHSVYRFETLYKVSFEFFWVSVGFFGFVVFPLLYKRYS